MPNLLPPQKIKELQLNFLAQTIVRVAFALVFMLLILILLLFVARIFLQINFDTANKALAELEAKPEIKQLEGLEEKIKTLNADVALLNAAYQKQFKFSSLLESLTQDMPSGIRLYSISCAESGQIDINGYAPTREILLKFEETLKKAPYVTELNFPISNITQQININFYLGFKIKHEL